MENVNASGTGDVGGKRPVILYPLMLIAAIAVIVFSLAGIATMMGWLPGAQSQTESAEQGRPSARQPAGERPRAPAPGPASCTDCGVVESIRAVEVRGEGTGVGAIGGALIGGVLGNQVGRGSGRTAATVVGAGAGAYAGNEIEKNVKKSVRYQVRVRMTDGTYRIFHERAQPAYGVGQKVRVTGQGLIAAG